MNRHARGIATLVAFIAALVIGVVALATDAHADEPQLVLDRHGVVVVNTLPVCSYEQLPFPRYRTVPCMEPYREGSALLWYHPTTNSMVGAWAKPPAKPWHWPSLRQQRRYSISKMEQVRRVGAYLKVRDRSGTHRRILR